MKTLIRKDICAPIFITVLSLFTIANIYKQPKWLSVDEHDMNKEHEWIRICVYMCVSVCMETTTQWNITQSWKDKRIKSPAICNSMDGPGGYYVK